MVTVKEIYKKLNLIDPDLFSSYKKEENITKREANKDLVHRGTGRTTNLLVHSILNALEGNKVIVIPSTETKYGSILLFENLILMLKKLNATYIDEENTIAFGLGGSIKVLSNNEEARPYKSWLILRDSL